MKKVTKRLWLTLILIGLAGQFAWTIENMYFNVFLYNTISTDPTYIAWMVGASAVVATATTLIMGAVSDRVGNRKLFIVFGYILWGVSTAAFGFVTKENAAILMPTINPIVAAATMVVILDCVMTFFGSTANDAAFNAYVTDVVDNNQRGRVEGVLAILPLLSMLLIFGIFDPLTKNGQWQTFFLIFGGVIVITGIIGLFLIQDSKIKAEKKPFWESLVYGFKPNVIKTQPQLYLSLVAMCIFSIAVQIFFPFLIIYIQHFLRIDNYALVLGVVLITASVVSVLLGKFIDKVGRIKITIIASVVMMVGLFGMFIVRDLITVMFAGSVMMSGYMLVTAALSAQIRDFTPVDKVGHFQGIRMIFAVMLPMLIGPFIGAEVIKGNAQTYIELGVIKTVPTPMIFLASAIALLFVLIPIFIMKRSK